MSIRPIDMMMMPNKSQETSILQHQAQQRLEHDQNYQENQFQNNVKRDGERTLEPEKSEYEEFRYKDKQGNQGGGSSDQGQKKKKNEKEESKEKEVKISSFDVRI